MHLSIDITPEQHQRLKTAAALQGKSISDYILELAFAGLPETNADMQALESVLKARLSAAQQGSISSKSVEDIFADTLRETGHG